MVFRNGSYEGHGYDLWMTPEWLIDGLENEFGLMFDPCPPRWDGSWNGLEIKWKDVNFVNPPYGDIQRWVEKCHVEAKKGKTIFLLIPNRSCSHYFHDHILAYPNLQIVFISGRVAFTDGRNPNVKPKGAPFPSILCVFNPTEKRIHSIVARRIKKVFMCPE